MNIDKIINNEIKPVVDLLNDIKTPEEIFLLMSKIHNKVESALEKYQDKKEKEIMDCHKGCKTCCRLNVSVLHVETICILEYLKNNLTDDEFKSFSNKIRKYYLDCMGLEDEDRIVAGLECIFLTEEGYCSIYPVRPLICRSVTSNSQEKCKESFFSVVFGEESTILMNLFQKELMLKTFSLIGDNLGKNGYNAKSFHMSYALNFFNEENNVKNFMEKKL
jgi:Fe-S-cluster containining protein